MCGIAGIYYYNHARSVDRGTIEAMTGAMVHRGPDDAGVYVDGHIGLGHRRLSIIDLAGGHQPMSNKDGTIWITFNGEIYNYRELREELIAKGHQFKTRSDTEVIVHLYEDMGEGCVQRLNGMFAFAIWDKPRNHLFIARDRLGIKPLYYARTPDFLAFSSEIKPLLTIPGIERSLDRHALHDYLTFRYNIAPRTMFRHIQKLEPAHVMTAQDTTIKLHPYWDLDFSKKLSLTEGESTEEFYRRFEASTRSHLVGEVPLGVLLSGGLDSTAVAAVMAGLAGSQLKTFSVGFEEENADYDERPYARRAAAYYGADHHEIGISANDFIQAIPDYVRHMEEPMADPASIPLYYVSKLAKAYVTVILSGEGSDELLAGYTFGQPFQGYERALLMRKIPAFVRQFMLGPLNKTLIGSERLSKYLRLAALPVSHYPQVQPIFMADVFSEDLKHELYRSELTDERFPASAELAIDAYRKTTGFEFLDQMLYVYSKQWLPDDLLLKADKMTMAHSLELRVPFLDHTFVEFLASLPTSLKLRRNRDGTCITKYILRKAFADKIPAEILQRKKLGFPVPLQRLFRSELKTYALDVFHSQSFQQRGVFKIDRIFSLVRDHESGIDRSAQLWSLLVFGLWSEAFQVAG